MLDSSTEQRSYSQSATNFRLDTRCSRYEKPVDSNRERISKCFGKCEMPAHRRPQRSRGRLVRWGRIDTFLRVSSKSHDSRTSALGFTSFATASRTHAHTHTRVHFLNKSLTIMQTDFRFHAKCQLGSRYGFQIVSSGESCVRSCAFILLRTSKRAE